MNKTIDLTVSNNTREYAFSQSSSQKKTFKFIDSLFSGGLYLTLGAACVSNLRITPKGPALMLEGVGGYPFIYEIGVAAVLLAVFLKILYGIPVITRRQKWLLVGLALFYAPIFLNFFLSSFDKSQFIGGGQLRLQLEVWLLGTALIVYPITKRTVSRAMVVVVSMAFANSLYALAASQDIITPIYQKAYRIPGVIRQSGFFEMPGYLGVLCSIAVSWALWLGRKKYIRAVIICICGFAVIVADSRTGMGAILVSMAAKMVSRSKTPGNLNIFFACILIAMAVVTIGYLPESFWDSARPLSIFAAIRIWSDHPSGVPWGTFDQFNIFLGRVVSPHNWPAIALLYGGIFSFLAVALAHIWLVRLWLLHRRAQSSVDRLHAALVLIMLSITVSSWAEQVLQAGFAAFIFVTAAAYLVHLPPNTTQISKALKPGQTNQNIFQ
jgi:hypothetical protein